MDQLTQHNEKIEPKIQSILNVYKPLDWTSFDVVSYLKRDLPKGTKIGHAGTLDPLASGILILAIGKENTKKIPLFQDLRKKYLADITLGAVTETYDLEFYPQIIEDTSNVTLDQLEKILEKFTGTILQKPPLYSALKINGKKAYKYARQGKEEQIKDKLIPRSITIHQIELLSFNQDNGITNFRLAVECSKGTYIRSLAHDIGQELGVGGFLGGLERTAIGDYTLETCLSLEQASQTLKDLVINFSKE
jgi:tRNA pseudouridine55 synthase